MCAGENELCAKDRTVVGLLRSLKRQQMKLESMKKELSCRGEGQGLEGRERKVTGERDSGGGWSPGLQRMLSVLATGCFGTRGQERWS